MDFPKKKHRYAAKLVTDRAAVIEQLWQKLEVESLRAYRKYYRRLSNLSIKADFCLALDVFNRSVGLEFEKLFAKELRLDLENMQPIKHHLKKIMGRGNLRRAFPEDHNVSHTRLIYDLDYVNTYCKPAAGALCSDDATGDQIFNITKKEVESFLVTNYGAMVYEDWLSHFVYGESLRALAVVRGVSHETIRTRICTAAKGLKQFLKRED